MQKVSVLFLGASKRVSLLERFVDAALRLNIELEIFSCESSDHFCPISTLATVLAGPSFLSAEFDSWLYDAAQRHSIDISIPNMDSAAVALSRFAKQHSQLCWCLVSDHSLCESMHDKRLAEAFFGDNHIPVPHDTNGRFPKILKPRFGFGAKDIHIVHDAAELASRTSGESDRYIVQDFLAASKETSVDIYLSPKHGLLGYVLRDRLEISDGEVMTCRTRLPSQDERTLIERIAGIRGWQGCITLQYLTDTRGTLHVVEINPRFGGGATCAIEAGLDMASYILLEYLNEPLSPPKRIRNLIMSRARRDFFHEY
jgi:ATP-grasp in the biosynthetic pathway with Ter operon